ncbi:hypothetical protein [Haloferula sp. A504]|uniref:hypothetical protein n=1 Tax=Haloferula sp. A504 TaxID=3373601 RepID=UPI0031C2CA11|nr:hypothetical protein [Verrucomicrobiaceae bacterium E54]
MIFRLIRLAVPLLALLQLAHAGPTVRVLSESLPAGVEELVMLADDKASEPFKPPTKYLSDEIEPPARAFELRTSTDRRLVGRIALPEEGDRFILLLLSKPDGTLHGIVLRADQPGFRPGDNYLFNRTGKSVVGYVGTTRFRLKPGAGRVVRPSGRADEGFHQVGFGVEEDAGTRALSMTRWPVDSEVRSYVFFFNNPRTGRVDYRAVDEFIPAVKPE